MDNNLKTFMEIICNFLDAYTVSFFEINDDILRLKYFFTLSNNLKKDIKIKIGESIIGWIAKHKKPVNIKGDKLFHKILEIYKKDEDIKTYFVLPVGNRGVLYIDSKRSYSITEKHQRILIHCAKYFENLLKVEEKLKNLKKWLKNKEFIKKFDYKNFLNYVCNYFKFEWGVILKKEGESFVVLNSTNKSLPYGIIIEKESKIGLLLKKNIKKISFLENIYIETCCLLTSSENITNIKNCLIIPFLTNNITVGALILFNGSIESIEDFSEFHRLFELKFFEEVFKYEAYKKTGKILMFNDFFNGIKKFEKNFFIYFKLKNFLKFLERYPQKYFEKIIEKILLNLEKISGDNLYAIKISPNIFSITGEKDRLKKIENFVEKNFKNSYFKINDTQIYLSFELKIFEKIEDFLKFTLN